MSWAAIETALRAWVKAGSGLADDHVVWAEQTGARPSSAFATLRLGAAKPLGAVDEVVQNYDSHRAAGSEIELQVRSLRECSVSVQLFNPTTTGDSDAFALAQATQSALYLPSIRSLLQAAGLSPFDPGTVTAVNALVGARFEARALFEVRFYAMLTVSEFTTWIEHCTPTGTIT